MHEGEDQVVVAASRVAGFSEQDSEARAHVTGEPWLQLYDSPSAGSGGHAGAEAGTLSDAKRVAQG
jgi:hypothetical protein